MGAKNQNDRVKELISSAVSYFNKEDFESAIEELKTAEILDDQNPEILFNLGVVHSKQGLHKTAIRYYEKLLLLPSTFVDQYRVKKLLSYSLILSNRYDEALAYLHETLRVYPNDTVTLSLLGFCYEKMERLDDAIGSYDRVLKVDRDDINAFNSLAYLLAKKGTDLDKALAFARKAYDKNPESAAYNDTIGFVYMKRGQGDMARRYMKKALEKDPASAEIRTHLHELLKI
jgi:tetratricopeptide (TPR) repeat protein